MDCSRPGLPVHHQLPLFTQTHVHWVGDVIQPSHSLLSPSPPTFNLCKYQGFSQWVSSFPMSQFFTSGGQSIGASASVLPMNVQGWFPLRLIGLIFQSKWLSRVFSTTIWKHQVFSSQPSLWSNSHITCIHDYWKNRSFDCTDPCWQTDISASLVSDREF